MVEDPAKDPQYKEAAIDAIRAQKDEVRFTLQIYTQTWNDNSNCNKKRRLGGARYVSLYICHETVGKDSKTHD